ncbi:MAG TPA: DegT/DnrJ/EryC1/StrS aminotransferase family protein [Candidatus Aquilonibacter sp.]|nr:DegT/DnrJ/EryC1/StrS aminotransferase family protein [Candidatus Aquilonibacter sp.]
MRQTFLPYCKPVLTDDEIGAVAQSLRNSWLTTGPVVRELETAFAERTGVKHAIALSSCTAALHVALHAMGVGPGDEVVMPSLTFVAGAQCTMELGAKPVFADIDPGSLSLTVASIDAVVTERTKVIMPMPYGGRPLDIAAIVEYARPRGIRVLEDAAHAAGMFDRGEWAGTRSDAAAYSFYATKNLTSAEGGILLTNDDALAERARVVGLHGMDKDAWKRYTATGSWRYDVREPGFKYNLPDPLAALALAQLGRLNAMQDRRDEIAARYDEALSQLPGVRLQTPPANPGDRHSWCMYVMMIDERRAGISRDAMIDALRAENIGTSVHYIPTHLFSGYRSLGRFHLPATEHTWEQLISLPLYPAMTDADVDDVIGAIQAILSPRSYAIA